jgi:hypothetical protein
MKPQSLLDMVPENSSFSVNGRVFPVRLFTLDDQAWVMRTFPGDAFQAAFRDPVQLLRIAFHQLPIEVQKEFTAVEREVFDDETGEIKTERLAGWRLFSSQVPTAPKVISEMAEALTAALVGSSAAAEMNGESEGEVQKKTPPSLTSAPLSIL